MLLSIAFIMNLKSLLTIFFAISIPIVIISSYLKGTEQVVRCKRTGGIWITNPKISKSGKPECSSPTSDAGKVCSDSSECQSYCSATVGGELSQKSGTQAVGRCYEWTHANCMREVNNGILQKQWCLDPNIY